MTVTEAAPIAWFHSLDEGLRRARETGKGVMIDFFSPT